MEIYGYTDQELEALEYYTSRKEREFLKTELDYKNVNAFLRFLSIKDLKECEEPLDRMSTEIMGVEGVKEVMGSVEALYSLACKYGTTHTIPEVIYRGDDNASRMLKNKQKIGNDVNYSWETDSFLSCTKSEGEIQNFLHSGKGVAITIMPESKSRNERRMPFIDVNDLLGSNQDFGDEKEIIVMPFLSMEVISTSYGNKIPGARTNYLTFLSAESCAPESNKDKPSEYSDEDLEKLLELAKRYKAGDDSTEVVEDLNRYRTKVRTCLQMKLMSIYKKIMPERGQTFADKLHLEILNASGIGTAEHDDRNDVGEER